MATITGDAGDNILSGTSGADVVSGLAGADVLHGLEGDDSLDGGDGDDILQPGLGDDTAAGGAGTDRYYLYGQLTASGGGLRVVIDLAAGTASKFDVAAATLIGFDHLSGIENATATNYNDDITGDAGANALSGSGGDDRIWGGDGADVLVGDDVTYNPAAPAALTGNDLLYGQDGADVLQMSYGTDTLDGGAGTDELYAYLPGPRDTTLARVVVDLGAGIARVYESNVLMGTTTLVSIENVTGSNLGADQITGDGGVNRLVGYGGDDVLDGAGGADVLVGGLGSDTYYVDNAGDTIVELAGQGLQDTVHATVAWTLGAEVERLVLDGVAAIGGTGNAGDNEINGNDAANVIDGGAGDDILRGKDGDDVLIGGAGEDVMVGGAGADTFRVTQVSITLSHGAPPGAIGFDRINDLVAAQGDRLDLSPIDADASTGGDDAFHLSATFTGHAAEMVLTYDPAQLKTLLQLDCDGDGHADYRLWIAGNVTGDSGGWLL